MRRRIFQKNFSESEEESINVTPLIDVVFVVLIMFIVIAPLVEADRIELASFAHTDHHKTKTLEENPNLTIHVYSDNSIKINGKTVPLTALKEVFSLEKKQGVKKIPQLFQDAKSSFGTFQKVKNALEEAGFEEVDVVLKPD